MTREQMKTEARELKRLTGEKLSKCYEIVAKKYKYRDWNTASALAPKETPNVRK